MDPIAKAQLLAALATISAALDNFIQTTSTRNQRLDRIASCLTPTREVVKKSDSTTHPHRSRTQKTPFKNDVKEKNVETNNRNKGLKKKFFKIGPVAKCNKCQGYGHLAVDCTRPVKIIINNGVPTVNPESKSAISS